MEMVVHRNVGKQQHTLRNIPEERSSEAHNGGSLKSGMELVVWTVKPSFCKQQ
jgi:hypothetical protein